MYIMFFCLRYIILSWCYLVRVIRIKAGEVGCKPTHTLQVISYQLSKYRVIALFLYHIKVTLSSVFSKDWKINSRSANVWSVLYASPTQRLQQSNFCSAHFNYIRSCAHARLILPGHQWAIISTWVGARRNGLSGVDDRSNWSGWSSGEEQRERGGRCVGATLQTSEDWAQSQQAVTPALMSKHQALLSLRISQ